MKRQAGQPSQSHPQMARMLRRRIDHLSARIAEAAQAGALHSYDRAEREALILAVETMEGARPYRLALAAANKWLEHLAGCAQCDADLHHCARGAALYASYTALRDTAYAPIDPRQYGAAS